MFDKTENYNREIKRHLEQAYKMCVIYNIPFFASCCVMDDGERTKYENLVNGSVSNGIHLFDDHITRHINVSNGFETYLKDHGTSIDFDDDCPDFDDDDFGGIS